MSLCIGLAAWYWAAMSRLDDYRRLALTLGLFLLSSPALIILRLMDLASADEREGL